MKKISIIVPCFNHGIYLDDALRSVWEQSYSNWECIIVNDGSTDNTYEKAQEWQVRDKRFHYLYQENKGLSSARNLGISRAEGEFILPLDADDMISPDYLLLSMKSFEKDSTLKVVYSKVQKFGDEKGLWDLPEFSLIKLARYNMIICSAVFKKIDWERVGGYDTKMIYGLEDWEFWIAILKDGGNVERLDEIGFYYRIRKGSMARIMNAEERKYSEKYVSRKHIQFVLANYDRLQTKVQDYEYLLTSEKFILNLLTTKLFGKKILTVNEKPPKR